MTILVLMLLLLAVLDLAALVRDLRRDSDGRPPRRSDRLAACGQLPSRPYASR